MQSVEGVVKVVSKKEGNRYAIKLDNNQWYSGFGRPPETEKKVRLEYSDTESGGTVWHNIKNWAYIQTETKSKQVSGNIENLKTADEITEDETMELQKMNEIKRSVALKCAIEFVKIRPEEATLDLVIKIAKHFEDYIKGEM